jgi:hypothetical protein
MQYLLKLMLFAVLTVFGVALTLAPAHAQTGSRVLANMPFDFSLGNTTLKAGRYTVQQLQSGIIAFRSGDEKEHQFALTSQGDSDRQGHGPRLVFMRSGGESFLKRVFSGSGECRELSESGREKELIKNQAPDSEFSLLIQPAR